MSSNDSESSDPEQRSKRRRPPTGGFRPVDASMLHELFLDESDRHLSLIETLNERLWSQVTGGPKVTAVELDQALRALHSLKGAAGSVGHEEITALAHALETSCMDIRQGALAPTPGVLEGIGEDVATLRALVVGARHRAPVAAEGGEHVQANEPPSEQANDAITDAASTSGGDNTEPYLAGRQERQERYEVPRRRVRVSAWHLDSLADTSIHMVILRTRLTKRLQEVDGLHQDITRIRSTLTKYVRMMAEGLPAQGMGAPSGVHEAVFRRLRYRALGRLTDLPGELATSLAHIERTRAGLAEETERLEQQNHALLNAVGALRTLPLETLFSRLDAAVVELNNSVGTAVELVTSGGDIHIDRALASDLFDPFLHMIRNTFAHGIEPAETRRQRGKPEITTISILASQDDMGVVFVIGDDGKGIDIEATADRLSIGLDELRTDADIQRLLTRLFDPGFSTRHEADTLSGRGIGLSSVRSSVEAMGGTIQCTWNGRDGGAHFVVRVPLALGVQNAVLFKLSGQTYGVFLAHVESVLPSTTFEAPSAIGRAELTLPDGTVVPLLRLHAALGLETPPSHRTDAILLTVAGQRFAMTCDRVVGPRQVPVRPLPAILRQSESQTRHMFCGTTISGAGRSQLILNPTWLVDQTFAEQPAQHVTRRRAARILIVDDSRLSRESTRRLISSMGLSTLSAQDGWTAWEILNERRIDLVVTDLDMPRIDGYELMARIRREPTLRQLPVVVLSSRTSVSSRVRAEKLGASEIIAKSKERRVLRQTIERLLKARRGQ